MSDRVITLSADLDRTNVASLAQEAAELLASGCGVLRLGGASVARVRLSSIQMLASAAQSATNAGASFELADPSPELVSAIRLCGLSDLLLSPAGSDVQ